MRNLQSHHHYQLYHHHYHNLYQLEFQILTNDFSNAFSSTNLYVALPVPTFEELWNNKFSVLSDLEKIYQKHYLLGVTVTTLIKFSLIGFQIPSSFSSCQGSPSSHVPLEL